MYSVEKKVGRLVYEGGSNRAPDFQVSIRVKQEIFSRIKVRFCIQLKRRYLGRKVRVRKSVPDFQVFMRVNNKEKGKG